MKKIAIIAMATALKGEKGYTRFDFLANMLVQRGYDVDLITSSFQHWEKKQRDRKSIKSGDSNYHVVLIDEPGYKKNIDIMRVISHHILGKNLKKYLEKKARYDLIYSIIPPNNTAKISGQYAASQHIPFIVDVEDLWPEAMKIVFDLPIVSNLLYFPLLRSAEATYKLADGIIGTSDEYRKRPFKRRVENIESYTVYVGIDLEKFDQGVLSNKTLIDKEDNEFWVTYAGTLGASYDIKTLIIAAGKLKSKGYESIKFKVLGNGPKREELEQLADRIDCNVEFLGYVPYEKMAAYLSKSDIVINSVVKKSAASIITKIGDYLASETPMINTCSSSEFRNKVEQDKVGINIEAENVNDLTEAIKYLYQNKEVRIVYGKNARQIAEKEFDRKNAYLKIINLINQLLNGEKNESY